MVSVITIVRKSNTISSKVISLLLGMLCFGMLRLFSQPPAPIQYADSLLEEGAYGEAETFLQSHCADAKALRLDTLV